MFENIEKILRCRGKLCVEKERYGDGIFLGIDIAGYIDNATDDKDASIVYTGNDIANAIDIATSPGDMDAMEALFILFFNWTNRGRYHFITDPHSF